MSKDGISITEQLVVELRCWFAALLRMAEDHLRMISARKNAVWQKTVLRCAEDIFADW